MLKLVVPIKQVVALDDEFELDEGATVVDPDFLERELNEWDTFSVEAAVQIKEAHDDVEVVVVSVGDEEAEDALVDALARGADRGVRIPDDDLTGDTLEVARVLAAAVARESPDLVLCGVQSSDAASSATGIALAAHLRLPHVAVVRKLDFNPSDRRVAVERELEGGTVELLELPTPALLTVQTGTNEPRYATLRAIKQAADKPLEVIATSDLGLDAEAISGARGARITSLTPPNRGEGAEMLEGDPDAVASKIASILKDKVGSANGGRHEWRAGSG